jgi:GNAT superfamily N-acetyltransferase
VIRHYGGTAFDLGTAFRTDDSSGCACWLAPGESVDEAALGGVLEAAVEPERLGVIFEFMEQVGASHPEVDHWHLPGIGVDPSRQGTGLGSLLLAHTLGAVDRNGGVAYLESSSPLNVPLYERFGFEVIAEIQTDDSPTIWPMLRPAR